MKNRYYQSLVELRLRLIKCLVVFGLVFGLILYKNEAIIRLPLLLMLSTLDGITLFTQNITTGLFFRLKMGFYLCIAICMPYFIYHIYGFISIGLFKKERKMLFAICTLGVLLGYVGFCLSIFYLLPLCVSFFKTMQLNIVQIKEFVELDSFLSLCFGIGMCGFFVFQTPIVIFALLKYGFLNVKSFSKFRRLSIPLYLLIGGVLTPPDVLSQVICASIMLLLTEIGFVTFLVYKYFNKTKSTNIDRFIINKKSKSWKQKKAKYKQNHQGVGKNRRYNYTNYDIQP